MREQEAGKRMRVFDPNDEEGEDWTGRRKLIEPSWMQGESKARKGIRWQKKLGFFDFCNSKIVRYNVLD